MTDPATATVVSDGVLGPDGGADASEVVTFTAVLPISRRVVQRVADLLAAHRAVIGTRAGRRSPSCFE